MCACVCFFFLCNKILEKHRFVNFFYGKKRGIVVIFFRWIFFISSSSVAELSKSLSVDLKISVVSGLLSLLKEIELLLVESEGSSLSSLLTSLDDLSLLPTHLGAEITQDAERSELSQSKDLKSLGNDHSLSQVVGGGDTLESFQSGHSGGTSLGGVVHHASDALPEDSSGGSVMGVASSGVVSHLLSELLLHFELISVQRARDVDLLSSNNDDSLAVDKLLSNDRSESTEQVTLTINDDFLLEHFYIYLFIR